ncbi:hypothetical protein MAHJHV63_50100 [Mycobacterium avium subsp. hominissuis]
MLCASEASRPAVASLAHSTQGSFLRQLGWHALARGWDGRPGADRIRIRLG